MGFRRFFRFILVVILLLGMCGMLSSTAYRSGWSEGFVSGQTADGAQAGNVSVGPGFGHSIFSFFWWGLAAFFKFLFFMFFIGLIFKLLFGRRRWRHGGPWKGDWKGGHWGGRHGKWHQHHKGQGHDFKGQRPPWYDDSDGEPVMKA
jgi:hypothetical protein